MVQFHETYGGRDFYQGQIPRIVKALEEISQSLKAGQRSTECDEITQEQTQWANIESDFDAINAIDSLKQFFYRFDGAETLVDMLDDVESGVVDFFKRNPEKMGADTPPQSTRSPDDGT